jgi:hypothetical protein
MSVNLQFRAHPPNRYDRCLLAELEMWRRIVMAGGVERVAQGRGQIVYEREPWLHMPAQGKRFQKLGSLVRPLDDGADYLVNSFLVPTGYDGVIITMTGVFTGVGFVESSGDLTWRLRIGRRYAKDYGNVQISLGDLRTPYAIHGGGIRIYSNQLVRQYINVAIGAGAWLDPKGRIICACTGWFYPLS